MTQAQEKITAGNVDTAISAIIMSHDTSTAQGCEDCALHLWALSQGIDTGDQSQEVEVSSPAREKLYEKACILFISAMSKRTQERLAVVAERGR